MVLVLFSTCTCISVLALTLKVQRKQTAKLHLIMSRLIWIQSVCNLSIVVFDIL